MLKELTIMDNTLREGEQTVGVVFNKEAKTKLARLLDNAGIDFIEAGFPAVSKEEMEMVKHITHLGLRAKIMGLARTTKEDIDLVIESGCDGVTFFIPTSEILIQSKKIELTKKDIIQQAVESVTYAKKNNLFVAFGAEDSTRTDADFLFNLYDEVSNAGADAIAIVDTVSQLNPITTYEIVHRYKARYTESILSVHLHNDYGLATANAVAAIIAGADQIQTTINGLGERAGSPSLQETVMAANMLTPFKFNNIKTNLFCEMSRAIEEFSGIKTYPLKPIVGDYAFAHESGLHASSVLNNPLSYEIFDPAIVGNERKFFIGKHSGKKILAHILDTEFGITDIKECDMKVITEEVKKMSSEEGKSLSSRTLLEIYEKNVNEKHSEKEK